MSVDSTMLYEEFDSLVVEDYWPHEKVSKLDALCKVYEETGEQGKAEDMRREARLLNVTWLVPPGTVSDIWRWCRDNLNKPFSTWRREDVDYYKTRLSETSNPLHKARYSYAIWTITRELTFAEEATRQFLFTAQFYIREGVFKAYYKTMSLCFELAAKMSLSLSLRPPLDIRSIMKTILSAAIGVAQTENKGRGLSDLINLLASLSEDLKKNQEFRQDPAVRDIVNGSLGIARSTAQWWHDKGENHWYEIYLGDCMRMTGFLDERAAPDFQVKIAESKEEQAYREG